MSQSDQLAEAAGPTVIPNILRDFIAALIAEKMAPVMQALAVQNASCEGMMVQMRADLAAMKARIDAL